MLFIPSIQMHVRKVQPLRKVQMLRKGAATLAKTFSPAFSSGAWALFLCLLAMAAILAAFRTGDLLYLVENFQGDGYDTILSVQAFRSFGPLGIIPWFTGPHHLLGNFPLLFPIIASAMDLALNNASASTAVLYWLTDIAIAALLWTRFLRHCNWKIRLLFCVFFTVNIFFGNIFPLGFRKRQGLAMLAGMCMFLTDRAILSAAFSFLALLAQPFTGAALLVLRFADAAERKPLRSWLPGDFALLALPVILACLFYTGLFQTLSEAPWLAAYSSMTQLHYIPILGISALAFLALWAGNRREPGLLPLASLAMLIATPAMLAAFLLLKDALPAAVASAFHSAASSFGSEIMLNVAACGFVVSLWRRKAEPSGILTSIALLASIVSLSILCYYLYAEITVVPAHEAVLQALQGANITVLKTMELSPLEYSGSVHFRPLWPLFTLQGYAILHGSNITFLDEVNLPPQLSTGESNLLVSMLPQAIYDSDTAECRTLVSGLGMRGVQGVLYTFDEDITTMRLPWREHFTDEGFLGQCGAEIVSYGGDAGAFMILYRIRQVE